MFTALKSHWPEYLMEAFGLGAFMISASLFTLLLYHPDSLLVRMIPTEILRRCLMGLAMGLTAIAIIYSPWGKQSGAHINPAVTLAFWRLGKIADWDALFYILAQFAGGFAGVALVAAIASERLADPAVNYVVTVPGEGGVLAAFLAELGISFLLMSVVLVASNTPRLAASTGLFAGCCVAVFITLESPLSGMSMNPARSLGSAIIPHLWTSLWLYFVAPPVGMLLAAEVYRAAGQHAGCAKLNHQNTKRCIFCEHQAAGEAKDRLVPMDAGARAHRRLPLKEL